MKIERTVERASKKEIGLDKKKEIETKRETVKERYGFYRKKEKR